LTLLAGRSSLVAVFIERHKRTMQASEAGVNRSQYQNEKQGITTALR